MNVFDIMGPIMIGPSSSHTAGAARLGMIARTLLGTKPAKAHILLHGSFAQTHKGHGTDKAIIAGILGMQTDDERIRFSPEVAAKEGIEMEIVTGELDGEHPNTAEITLTDGQGQQICLRGSSIGGGNILVTKINGMAVSLSGQYNSLIVLHRDAPGTIASVTDLLAESDVNISNFQLSRESKGGRAVMTIELDGEISSELNDEINKLPNIYSSTMLKVI